MPKAVTLGTAWLNDAATPSDAISLPYMTSLQVTPAQTGEARRYAGGRLRAVSVLGKATAASLSAVAVTRAQVTWLEAHIGRTICLRDDRGRRLFAVYWEVPVDEHAYNLEADISLDLSQVTVVEAV